MNSSKYLVSFEKTRLNVCDTHIWALQISLYTHTHTRAYIFGGVDWISFSARCWRIMRMMKFSFSSRSERSLFTQVYVGTLICLKLSNQDCPVSAGKCVNAQGQFSEMEGKADVLSLQPYLMCLLMSVSPSSAVMISLTAFQACT